MEYGKAIILMTFDLTFTMLELMKWHSGDKPYPARAWVAVPYRPTS